MKRAQRSGTFLTALSFLALAMIAPTPAVAAVKAGASCSPLGKIATVGSSKFTCAKSGKKLIWKKILTPATVAPAPVTPVAPVVIDGALPLPATIPVITRSSANTTTQRFQVDGCHALVSAIFQKKSGDLWVDIAPADGWTKADGCDADHPYQAYVTATIADGTLTRWKIYAPGSWEFFSTPATVHSIITPTLGKKIDAIPVARYGDVALIARGSLYQDMPVSTKVVPIAYTFESGVFPNTQAIIKNGANAALSRYSPFLAANSNVHIFVFATSEFLRTVAPTADPGNKSFEADMANQAKTWGVRSPSNCTGMGGFAVSEVPFPFIAIDAPCKTNSGSDYGVLPHELTHTLEMAFGGGSNPRCWAPTWFVEGLAQVGGSATASDETSLASELHHKSWVARINRPTSVADIVAMEGETTDFSEYTLGAALSEYLVAKGGWNRALNLYAQASLQTTNTCLSGAAKRENFNRALQSLYGQSLDDFYTEAITYLQWQADHK